MKLETKRRIQAILALTGIWVLTIITMKYAIIPIIDFLWVYNK